MLSHQTGRLAQISLTPYKNMLCCSQFSEDNTMYRGRVKGEDKLGEVPANHHRTINLENLLSTLFPPPFQSYIVMVMYSLNLWTLVIQK